VIGRPVVTACRGCCCGTAKKHPDVDHAALLDRLTAGLGADARVRTSDCLGPCEESNVVVVTPAPPARLRGARAVWLRGVLDDAATDAVVEWVRAGGPGTPPPAGMSFPRPQE
jgi:(2Fe-2S) ferredoxin